MSEPTVDMEAPGAPVPLELGAPAPQAPPGLTGKLTQMGEVVDALVVLVGHDEVLAVINAMRAARAAAKTGPDVLPDPRK